MTGRETAAEFVTWGAWNRRWSPLTQAGYRRRVEDYLTWCRDRGMRPQRAACEDIRAWMDTLHPSAAVHTHARSALVAFYDHLIDAGTVRHNPARRIHRPPVRRSVPRSLEPEAVRAVLATAREYGAWWHCYAGLLCYAGLRRAEACGLRWIDVEGGDAWLRVLGKGRQERMLPVHASLRGLIVRHRSANPHPEWMFPGRDAGTAMSVATATKWMRRILDEAGLPDAVPHQSRHSLAVELCRQGWDLATVMEALGHSSLQSTTVYTKARPERVAQAVASLDW